MVSFLQATFNLMDGFSASPGHGHNYNPELRLRLGGPRRAAPTETSADTERLAQTLVEFPGR